MPSRTLTYPKTPLNKVNRYSIRETYDLETIHSIINSSSVLHVSFNTPDPDNPFPVTLPMVGVAASYDHPSASLAEPLDIYLHGYVSSRLMNLSRSASESRSTDTGTAVTEEPTGLPVTITATKIDGLVLSLTPNTHDINYRSATVYGYANIVPSPPSSSSSDPSTSSSEKVWAMTQITNSVLRNRWPHTRLPPDSAEMQSTSILKVHVVGGSGKIRVGGPRDEMKDLKRDEVRQKVWTGVVPVYEWLGDVVAGEGNLVEEVPEHVKEFVEETRNENRRYALAAIADRSQG